MKSPLLVADARSDAEAFLQRERHFSDTLVASVPGILYLYDEQGRFLRWNRQFEIVSGYSAEEVARMHPLDFFTGEEKSLLEERIREVFAKGESSVEAGFLTKDGRSIPFFFTGRKVLFDGVTCLVGMGIDLTERRLAERAMRESECKYRELVEHANSIILRWTRDGRITFLNEFGLKFFGYSAGEIIGRHVVGTIVPDTESTSRNLRSLMEQILENPKAFEQNINENVRRNGERIWIAWTNKTVLDEDGRIKEVLSIGTDITEKKKAHDEIRQLNVTLEQRVAERTAELEDANKELEAFSYSVSHDLRAPLRAINGFTGRILQEYSEGMSEEGKHYLERIRSNGEHMGHLIDDLLAFSRVSRQPIRREHVDHAKLVEAALEDLKPQTEGRRIEFRTDALPESEGDPRLLKQVWINLLSNAIKYSRGRAPALVETGSAVENGEPAYFVRDNGAGFDMKYAHKLFGVFQRLHRASEFEGTGVGLAIIQRIIHRHGGRIWAKAEKDRGATFYFTLPEVTGYEQRQ